MSFVLIFALLLLVLFAVIAYVTNPSQADKQTQARLDAINQRVTQGTEDDIRRKEVIFSRIALLIRLLRGLRPAQELGRLIEQAKLPWTVGRFCVFTVALVLLGALVGNWWLPVGFLGWGLGALLGLLPLVWVLHKRRSRMHQMVVQLPQAVELMARALRAGYSLPSSLVMVADEVPNPLGPEFRYTADELNFGLPFQEALANLAYRIPIPDLQLLVTAVLVQKETGGNLVELLEKIAAVLRARVQLAQKVRVYTAQGRLTGVILVALPFVLFVVLNMVNPGYSKPMFESEIGRRMVYAALAAMAIGIVLIRRIVNIRV